MNTCEPLIFTDLKKRTHALSIAQGFHDKLTQQHSYRVKKLCIALAQRFNLSSAEIAALKVSAVFHDIGKLGIPDRILLKADKLDSQERQLLQLHPVIGQQIINSINLKGAADTAKIIRHHHEYFDGTGYPDKLKGDQIPIGARIISVVDSYDAMSYTRPYQQSRKHSDIMTILEQESENKHDPNIFQVFADMIKTSPLKVR
ncbi:HD-GYP domain-containing protein [Amphritea sp. HPY]|uniref:HD-GYP domain-containing protein n=1 Tax=Amphritea sp. HPY TaxID=3421652 RepID=UPI003D7CC044